MRRTEMLQEIREMRFEEVYFGWNESRLSQEEEARIIVVSDRTFRRYINRYEETGVEGLLDNSICS
ncbi:MAG: helix-turn-helix domain-containing protein [Desulfobacterales bacterium]|nr:helix-turn-helix domain-containing protein [Desulfobacterales bacterium]